MEATRAVKTWFMFRKLLLGNKVKESKDFKNFKIMLEKQFIKLFTVKPWAFTQCINKTILVPTEYKSHIGEILDICVNSK